MFYKTIAVDFDGTLCENKWPEIGEPNHEVINYVKEQRVQGAKIILWTCRDGQHLENAVNWCTEQGLIFDAVNDNIPEAIEQYGGNVRKVSADEYIDDKACLWFELPYVKKDTGIDNELIGQLEEMFGFVLYDWQKEFLKGIDSAFPKSGRNNGKTFAYCLRLLLDKTRGEIDLRDPLQAKNYADVDCGPNSIRWFHNYICRLNLDLTRAGIKTNAKMNTVRAYDKEGELIGEWPGSLNTW